MKSKDKAYSLIQKTGNLPTLPSILLKLLAACDNDNTPMSEIAALISKDPVLSFKVLQLVNSAYYGFRYSFTGIEQAVVFLGANVIKNLAITMSIHQVFERKRFKNIDQFDINAFWYYSLMRATLAKRIAQKSGFSNLDEAYLSGLLLDIGRLILISTFPTEHQTILAESGDIKNTLQIEKQLLGVTHCEAGSWLMQKWKMGSTMADAIQYHHEPLQKIHEAFPLVKIVYIANILNENIDNIGQFPEIADLLPGLNRTRLEEVLEGAAEEVEQVAANLEIKIQKPAAAPTHSSKPVKKSTEDTLNSTATLETTPPPLINDNDIHGEALQEVLTSRIKRVSLLSSFLENLAHAGDVEGIIAACEQAMSILFNIDKVIFFLPDKENILLKGQTSPLNILHQTSQELTLTLLRSTSLIVKSYHDMVLISLTDDKSTENLADEQIQTVLSCKNILLVPLVADKKPAGVLLLGLPQGANSLAESDMKLIQVIAQQVGICLQLEKMKEQKREELEAERKAAVSMTARKVAHEINNPLGIISNYIASLKMKLSDHGEIQNELTIIDEEIHRISTMIGELDILSKDPLWKLEFIDVNAVIEDIIHLARSANFTSAEIAISFQPGDNLPHIMTSKNAIKQILINLIKNAAEAMTTGGSVTVQTSQAAGNSLLNKNGIEIVVSDTGPGLPETVLTNLYSPFVTTKQNGHSGLGLSIVHKTVKDLGGTISHSRSLTGGTSFSIFLANSDRVGEK